MSKKFKSTSLKTNTSIPVKIELYRIIRDYQTQTEREIAVSKSEPLAQLQKEGFTVPMSRDTFDALEQGLNDIKENEVLSLPKDLQDWIFSVRKDLQPKPAEQKNRYKPAPSTVHVMPKRKIKRRIIEQKVVDGKIQETTWTELR